MLEFMNDRVDDWGGNGDRSSDVRSWRTSGWAGMNRPTSDIDKKLDQAVQYHKEGELEKARQLYEKILQILPEHLDALHLLGVVAHQVGNNEKAIRLIGRAIQIDPSIPYYYNNLGEALRDQGSLEAAITSYKKALLLKHDYPEAYKNMGSSFQAQGKLDEAISCYKKALQTKPDWAEAHSYLGSVYQAQGRFDEAIASYQRALEIHPEYLDAYYNMGMALKESRRLEEAIGCFEKSIQLKPDLAEAYNSLGIVFKEQGKLDGATYYYKKALGLEPNFAEPYNNLGNVLQEQGKIDEAIICYRKALEIRPDYADVYNQLVRQLEKTCAWNDLKALRARLDDLNEKALEAGEKCPEMPLVNISRCADPAQNLAIARSWSRDIERSISGSGITFSFDRKKLPKQRITVGYISNDFRNHAVAQLICGLFGLHNRNEFKVFSYSYGPNDGSYYRKKIEEESDRFIDLRHLGDREAAKRIYEDQVHILVDLMGHTGNNRLAICAYQPAPVQVTYLGYPGGTGAEFFDYMITDRIVTPEEHVSFYSENLVYMPHSYQANDRSQIISDKDWKKGDLGLPEKGFVFCSFSQPFKIEPVMFDIWMNILSQVPESVLWLLCRNESAEENLKREAESRGISSARLVFAAELPKEEHLARQAQADLILDTRIYNGHTTTSDALWAGVPVLTLQGTHFASRVSASLLKAVGLPELITHSLKEYEAFAVRLSRTPSELQAIRQKLKTNRFTEPLFDTPRFAKNLEWAYKEMWRIYTTGERPKMIEVKEVARYAQLQH
jgi:protein O-GlcNAc transferase